MAGTTEMTEFSLRNNYQLIRTPQRRVTSHRQLGIPPLPAEYGRSDFWAGLRQAEPSLGWGKHIDTRLLLQPFNYRPNIRYVV